MANAQLRPVLRHIHRLAGGCGTDDLTDSQLLQHFASQGDEAAFAALVRRYGRLVLSVCRHVLGHEQDAEDAFQATFLVLVRKAASIRKREALASWLHGVAFHLAHKAKRAAARRRIHERQAPPMPQGKAHADLTWRELQGVLEEEVNRLPEIYRAPFVLCCLDGQSKGEAARRLGCPEGTVSGRLARARKQLQQRLVRRGVALSAVLGGLALSQDPMKAAVPSVLTTSTIRAGIIYATTQTIPAGVLSAEAAALVRGVATGLLLAKCKIATLFFVALGLLVAGITALGHEAPAQPQDKEASPAAARPASKPAELPRPNAQAEMVVRGRVLDSAGKPLAEAQVAVLARQGLMLSSWEGWAVLRNEVLGQSRTDDQGQFQLRVPRTDATMTMRQLRVVAYAAGHGMGWKALAPDAQQAEAELRLTSEQVVRGRLVGLQGTPAVGVQVHVVRVTRPGQKGEREEDVVIRVPGVGFPFGPRTAKTDAQGNFVIQGLGPNWKVELEIRDDRYQRDKDDWIIDTADRKKCENIQLVLAPAHVVEGRVIYKDTGKPVAHARLVIASPYVLDSETDAQGRFRVSLYPITLAGGEVGVQAFPPEGQPYLPKWQGVQFPRGVVHREMEVALPRGVLVRGHITEAATGKPVGGANVECGSVFGECGPTHCTSGPDGIYQIGVAPGIQALKVTCPTGEYIPQVVGSAQGTLDKPIGDPSYYHAVVELNIKPNAQVVEAPIQVRRGETVRGRLIGPDGKPVSSAVMFVSGHRPRSERTMHPTDLPDGRFEIRGCDPNKTYHVLFLEHARRVRLMMTVESLKSYGQLWLPELLGAQNKLGAVVELSARKTAEPLVVRLAPCGSVKLRFRAPSGKPLAGYAPWLQLVVTPGPTIYKAEQDKTLAAEVITLVGRYGNLGQGDPLTDAQGQITFHGLIPGATYRLKRTRQEPINEVLKDFTVEAGKTAELDITTPKPPE
jgi:RNA polymerase sigma factor (sigma-70 family)